MNQTSQIFLTSPAVHAPVDLTTSVPVIDAPDARSIPVGFVLRARLKSILFETRVLPRFGKMEAVVLLIYASLLSWCATLHESWFDEAQAWLIARSSSFEDLFLHRLHYEGTPGLWHLVLWCAIRLHVPFSGIHVIAAAAAISACFVWLRYSPLPPALRLLMPFTYFLQYQYAVIARSYALAPLLAYLLMALYQKRKPAPLVYCTVAGLFANCSLHMAAFASGLAVIYFSDKLWTKSKTVSLRNQLIPAGVLAISFVLAAATAVPTADGSSTTGNPVVGAIRQTVSAPGATHPAVSNPDSLINIGLPTTEAPPQNALAQALWRSMNESTAQPNVPYHLWLFNGRVVRHLVVFLTAATASISTSNFVAIGFLLLLSINLFVSRRLIALLPWIFIEACNVLVAGEAHHFGLLWVALTCALWLLSLRPSDSGMRLALRNWLYATALAVTILQITWSAHALYADVKGPYSGNRQTAAFFASLPKTSRIAAFDDDSVTVNAFLPQSPYFNQQVDYWPFSRTKDPSLTFDRAIQQHPDFVSVKMTAPEDPVMYQWVTMTKPGAIFVSGAPYQMLLENHYHLTHRFCGHRFYRNSSESFDCRLIFEPFPPSPVPISH